jgi:hypothetical protein
VSTDEWTMQAYINGVEEDIRAAMGLASHYADPDLPIRSPGGDAETSQTGTTL